MPTKAGKRTSKAEIERRVNDIVKLIATGLTRAEIMQYVAEKSKWKAGERTIDSYIARAGELFAEMSKFSREKEIGKAKRRYEMIFAASLKVRDYQRAIAAQARLDNLLGLPAPTMLKLSAGENALLNQLLTLLNARNIPASNLFNEMINIMIEDAQAALPEGDRNHEG